MTACANQKRLARIRIPFTRWALFFGRCRSGHYFLDLIRPRRESDR